MAKKNYEDFPLSLALFDALPVIFFSVAMILITMRFRNVFFIKGAVLCAVSGSGKVVWHSICTFPSLLFFLITLAGMICMSVFAVKLDGTKLRSNWIEQITNAFAQGCFLLGVLFLIL